MYARDLKHQISFGKLTNAEDAFGETEETYEVFKTVKSKITSIGSKETFLNSKIIETATAKFEVRYFDGLTLSMQITYKKKRYDILEIANPFEKNKELIIAAKEVFQ